MASDGPEEFMEADDYLHTGDSLDVSTTDITDLNLEETSSTVIDMDTSSTAFHIRNGSLNSRPSSDNHGSLRSAVNNPY